MSIPYAEAALQRCSHESAPKKNAANLQENTHAVVKPQQSRRAALLKPHSNAGAHPQIPRTNPQKHLPTRAPLKDARIRVYSKIQINLK